MLSTPQEVIHRAGVMMHPEYEGVSPMSDCAGFYAFRRYPEGTELARLVTNDGRPAVRCYLRFVVVAPSEGRHVSRVELQAWCRRRLLPDGLFPSRFDPFDGLGQPDALTSDSAIAFARIRKPRDLEEDDTEGFIYDNQEAKFFDRDGRETTPLRMLDEIYTRHCRTLRLGFRIRWRIGSASRWVIHKAVWRGQDLAMWALFNLYDVELVDESKARRRDPFYKYRFRDFRRIADKPGERGHEASALYALAEVADATSPSGVATAYRDAADLATILGMRPLLALCLRCACQAMGPDRRDPEGSAATHLPSEQA
jgi:hypothetical protein